MREVLHWHTSATCDNCFQNHTQSNNISQRCKNYEIGCDSILINQVPRSFNTSLRWQIPTLDMWNLSADSMLQILHLQIILTNLEPLKPWFICSNCICSLITIPITITITITIPITLTTISTPEVLFFFLHLLSASPPSPRPLKGTNLQSETISQSSPLLRTIFECKIVQIDHEWFAGRLNRFTLSSTSSWWKGTAAHPLLELDLLWYTTYMDTPHKQNVNRFGSHTQTSETLR